MIGRVVVRSKQTDKESHFETGNPVTTNREGPNHLPQPSILWCDCLDCCIANTREHDIWNIFCASIAQGGFCG
jgi:hypothetical protein